MINLLTIIGARPQIIKAAAISRAVKNQYSDKIKEFILHTGQHYDENMSNVFFGQLGIPQPHYNLNVGSGKHGEQTAKMIAGIEKVLLKDKITAVLIYGDTNSTLAAAVAASKLHIPIVHVEAGLRSFNKRMPEEINRIMSDHVSTLLFSPTKVGLDNLLNEGFKQFEGKYTADNPGIYHCGDVMYDNSLYFSEVADKDATVIQKESLDGVDFILSTIHRPANTDNKEKLTSIFMALLEIAKDKLIILPLHPRTASLLEENLDADVFEKVKKENNIRIIDPVSFLDMIALEKNASMIITDSGGVQKEAYFFKKPCIILRPQTEWVEIVENGNASIVGSETDKILEAYRSFISKNNFTYPALFGDGKAGYFICGEIVKHLS